MNPTALVPFCSISDNFSAIGVKIDQIDVPVCNIFRPKILKDQLCYSVDLNKIKQKIEPKETKSFTVFLDYNEERTSIFDENLTNSKNANTAKNGIIVETIGIHIFSNLICISIKNNLEPLHLELENEYNLNVVKEISATELFLSDSLFMDKDVRKCQDDETIDECVTGKYINDLKDKCKCLPLNLRINEEVIKVIISGSHFNFISNSRFLFALLNK